MIFFYTCMFVLLYIFLSISVFFLFLFLFLVLVLIFLFPSSPFHLPTYLFKPSNRIITIMITVMFINITVTGVPKKPSGGEFQARDSSGIIYPYLSR